VILLKIKLKLIIARIYNSKMSELEMPISIITRLIKEGQPEG